MVAIATHADPVAVKSTVQSTVGHGLVTWYHKGTEWVHQNPGKFLLGCLIAGWFWGPFYDLVSHFLPGWQVAALCAVAVLGSVFWAALIPPAIKTVTMWLKHWRPKE